MKSWLSYQKSLLSNLLCNNALTILSEGLGLIQLQAHYLHAFCTSSVLVFLLNTDTSQAVLLQETLRQMGIDESQLPQVREIILIKFKMIFKIQNK